MNDKKTTENCVKLSEMRAWQKGCSRNVDMYYVSSGRKPTTHARKTIIKKEG